MFLPFEKWHGCLNDFIVVWLSKHEAQYALASLQRQASQLCSKKGDGIGADGILVLTADHKRDLRPQQLTIINQDGSLAQNCGNGLRCAALSVFRRFAEEGPLHDEPLQSHSFVVAGEEKTCHFLSSRKQAQRLPFVAVEMGLARLGSVLSWHEQALTAVKRVTEQVQAPELARDFFSAELGNRHLVFFLAARPEAQLLSRLGPALQEQPGWDGINVHLVTSCEPSQQDQQEALAVIGQPISELHHALVWERGVGPTPACGSGACAIVAAALSQGLAAREAWMAVAMPGGRLYVKQSEEDLPLVLAGPAQFVYNGTVEI